MARSPPLTATYMLLASLVYDTRGARDRNHGVIGNQHHVDAARKQRLVDAQAFEQVGWPDRCLKDRHAVDPRTAELIGAPGIEALHLQDQRGRTIRIFVTPERKTLERTKRP